MSVLIRNCERIISGLDPVNIINGPDILIEDGLVKEIGRINPTDHPDAVTVDGSGTLAMPGNVCSHHHYYSGLSRGIMAEIGPTPDFISTLQQLWWRIDRALDPESVYYSSLICSIDAIRAGTTSVIDHHSSPGCIHGSLDAIRDGFTKSGLRGMTCYEVTDRNGGMDEVEAGIAENLRFIARLEREKASGIPMMEAAIGGHAPFTIPDAGLEMLRAAVEESGRGIHMHIAEDLYDLSVSHHRYRRDLVVRLQEKGLIDNRSLLIHGLYLSDDDIDLLNDADGFLIHNARSNMNNHVGYCTRLPAVKNSALGTDGIGADMFEEFKFAFFKNRDAGLPLWPGDYLSTLNRGNEILKRYFGGRFGYIESGSTADIILLDYLSPTPLAAENFAGHLAFGLGSASVRTVVINGSVVMENREFPFDIEYVYREAAKHAKSVWERMNSID